MWARRRRKWRRHSKHFHRSQWVDDLRRIRSSYREMQYAKHITGLVCLILMMKTCAMKLFQNSHVVSLAVMQSLSLFYNLMCIIAQLIGIYVWYVGRHCHHHTYSIFMYQKVTIPFSVLKRRGNQWKWRRRWKYCRRSKHVIDIRKFRSHLLEKQRAIHLLGRVCVTLLVKNIAVALFQNPELESLDLAQSLSCSYNVMCFVAQFIILSKWCTESHYLLYTCLISMYQKFTTAFSMLR
ncbi:uncharacterized protein LOC126282025 isoform X2 [Schistocerca gregaria]|nr:uncharacterized protein LOC126282025 isoform X2 [Schistocerca gregaria]